MSNKHEISDQLVAYLDGTLSKEEGGRVEAHLETCTICRETLDDFRRTAELLAKWPDIMPSPAFDARFRDRVRPPAHRAPVFRRGWAIPSLRWAAMAAGILLVAGAAFLTVPDLLNRGELNDAERAEITTDFDLYQNLSVITHLETLQEMEGRPADQREETFVRNIG